MAACAASYSAGIDGTEVTPAKEVFPVPAIGEVKDFSKYKDTACYDRCVATYGTSGTNYTYCVIGCSLGGQKFDKVDFAINPFTPVREARVLTACEKKCAPELFLPPLYLDCLIKCKGGRSLKKPLEIVSVPVVAVPEVADFFKVCYEKCVAAYGLSGPDFASCLFKCTIGGGKKPYEKLQDTPVKFDEVKDYVSGGQKVQEKVVVAGVEPVANVTE
jgi:hypothetical protein